MVGKDEMAVVVLIGGGEQWYVIKLKEKKVVPTLGGLNGGGSCVGWH